MQVPGLWGVMWQSEKIINGEDREEQMSDYFYHLPPLLKALVDIGCRSIGSPDLMLLTVSFSYQSFSLFSFNKFQSSCNEREILSSLEVKYISMSISLMNEMPKTFTL